MKIAIHKRISAAFSLMEVLCAMALVGAMVTALDAGLSYGFLLVEAARENLRATQIIVEKIETVRFYTWEQLGNTNLDPAFTVPYNPNSTNGGFNYSGTVSVEAADFGSTPPSYATQMKKITIRLNWTSRGGSRSREAVTYYTRDGLQASGF